MSMSMYLTLQVPWFQFKSIKSQLQRKLQQRRGILTYGFGVVDSLLLFWLHSTTLVSSSGKDKTVGCLVVWSSLMIDTLTTVVWLITQEVCCHYDDMAIIENDQIAREKSSLVLVY